MRPGAAAFGPEADSLSTGAAGCDPTRESPCVRRSVLESWSINAVSKNPMNRKRTVAVALISGIAIGAVGVESLRAQSKPPGFLVAEFEVTDPVGWKSYQDGLRAMPPNGGVFLARAAKGAGLAGAQPKTITIVQFPTVEDAIAFDSSPAYAALKPLRDKSSNWRSYVVEGLPK